MSGLAVSRYPGSTVDEGGSAQVAVDTPQGKQWTLSLKTPDSLDKVTDFYKKEIDASGSFSTTDAATLTGKTKDGDAAAVILSRESDGTKILITVTKKK